MSQKQRYFYFLIIPFLISLFIIPEAHAKRQCGLASWYGKGRKTANGERFNPNGLTAAHRTLRFGTRVKVKNMRNGRTVTVRITDRGPFIKRRVIDVSKGAARHLGFISRGITRVCITY